MSLKLLMGGLFAAAATTAALAQPAPPPPAQGWNKGPRAAETRAQVIQHTQALFQRLDRNRDGALTQDELADIGDHGPGAPGTPPPHAMGAAANGGDHMFEMMDLNHDGVITRDEFNQAHARMGVGHHMDGQAGMAGHGMGGGGMAGGMAGGHGGGHQDGAMRGRMLMMADTNHDGRITLQELTAAALARFDRMDVNHDGTVTPEERAQARAQWGGGQRGQ